jgi:hypothetical protein
MVDGKQRETNRREPETGYTLLKHVLSDLLPPNSKLTFSYEFINRLTH